MSPQFWKDQATPSPDLVCFFILRARSKRNKQSTFSSQKGLLNPNSLSKRSVPFAHAAVAGAALWFRHPTPGSSLGRAGCI